MPGSKSASARSTPSRKAGTPKKAASNAASAHATPRSSGKQQKRTKSQRSTPSKNAAETDSSEASLSLFSSSTRAALEAERPVQADIDTVAATTQSAKSDVLDERAALTGTTTVSEPVVPMVAPAAIRKVLKTLREGCAASTAHVQKFLRRVEADEMPTSQGVSFLEAKVQTMLSYNLNLCSILLRKLHGGSLTQASAVENLARLRVILEKIRPIDKKLQYQIDKLIRLSQTQDNEAGAESGLQADPLLFKPNPAALMPKSGADAASESESEAEGAHDADASGVYRPPKIAAMPYNLDETQADRKARDEERKLRQLSRSSMLQSLREEISDRPMEVREERDLLKQRQAPQVRAAAEQAEYEEENFVRLGMSKKLKRRSNYRSETHDIVDFGGFRHLDGLGEGPAAGKALKQRMSSVNQKRAKGRAKRAKRM